MIDFSKVKISAGLKYTLNSMPRGKNYNGVITNTCKIPSYTVTVDANSNCILCGCDGWLPIPVGKVTDFFSLEEVWNSSIAKMLQNDIDEKKFTWCAVEHCGILSKNNQPTVYNLNINIDNSCNLACPSCRRDLLMINSGPEYDQKSKDIDRIISWLDKFNQEIMISLGGSGDALASFLIRTLIKKYQYKATQKFLISTNGLLLKKVMPQSQLLDAISNYSVSIDAGTKAVYENVRRPGNWEILLENLEWLAENRRTSDVTLNFVLQRDNYKDLTDFANICQQFGFKGSIQPLNDWGTWNYQPVSNPDSWTISNGTYLDHDVLNTEHPEHVNFIQILNNFREKDYKFIQFNTLFNKFK